jgi:orotidine-5'-phosphate decarboxylase
VPELVVALDVRSASKALSLVDAIGEAAQWYKVGPMLHVADGPAVVRELRSRGKRVFLDLKWHDIPNSVAGAVASAAEAGVALATLHLAGGVRIVEAAAGARAGGIKLVGVGVLTSMDAEQYAAVVGRPVYGIAEELSRLMRLGMDAGLDGYVAAVPEVRVVRAACPDAVIVVPGVRRERDAAGDQARTGTPREAVQAGADLVVVGRPITASRTPRSEAMAFVEEIGR